MIKEKINKIIQKYRARYNRFPSIINITPEEYNELMKELDSFLFWSHQQYLEEIKFMGTTIKKRVIRFTI